VRKFLEGKALGRQMLNPKLTSARIQLYLLMISPVRAPDCSRSTICLATAGLDKLPPRVSGSGLVPMQFGSIRTHAKAPIGVKQRDDGPFGDHRINGPASDAMVALAIYLESNPHNNADPSPDGKEINAAGISGRGG
jgi:hypothetical protein